MRRLSSAVFMLASTAILVVVVLTALSAFQLASGQGAFGSSQAGPPGPTERVTADSPAERVRERDFGAWRYGASRRGGPGGAVEANIRFDAETERALNAYIAANRKLAGELAATGTDANVIVTFRSLVSPGQLRDWVRIHNLRVNRVGAWTGGGSIGWPVRNDDLAPVPPDGQSIVGVYSINADVDARQLPAIAADPLVFLADVTPTMVRRDLSAAGIDTTYLRITFVGASPFWQGQQFGLIASVQNETVPTAMPIPTLPVPASTVEPGVPQSRSAP